MKPVVVEGIVFAVRHGSLVYRVGYREWLDGEYPDAEALDSVVGTSSAETSAGTTRIAIEGIKDYIGPERNENGILIAGSVDSGWYSHSTSWRVGRVEYAGAGAANAVSSSAGAGASAVVPEGKKTRGMCGGVGDTECGCIVGGDKIPGGESYEISRGGGIILTYAIVPSGSSVLGGVWRRVVPLVRQVQESSVAPSAIVVDADAVAVHAVRHLAFLLGRGSLPDAVLADSKSNPVWMAIASFDVGLAGVV